MPLVERNGLTFHTQVLGAGAPVCMLHGLLVGTLATWYFGAAPRLASKRRVLLYDLRGHGKSERPARGYGLASMAKDLAALLDGFLEGSEKVALVGHSWGALVALRFALDQPKRVERLALVEAPLPPSRAGEVGALTEKGPEEMVRALPQVLAGAIERGGRAGSRLVARLASLAGETSLLSDIAAEKDLDLPEDETEAKRSPLGKKLSSLRLPVLCLYGDQSACLPGGQRLARAIGGAELKVLKGGHYLPAESPQAVGDELVRFCLG